MLKMKKKISLDDGSEVSLEAGSELKVINEKSSRYQLRTYNFKINDRSGKKTSENRYDSWLLRNSGNRIFCD